MQLLEDPFLHLGLFGFRVKPSIGGQPDTGKPLSLGSLMYLINHIDLF